MSTRKLTLLIVAGALLAAPSLNKREILRRAWLSIKITIRSTTVL